MKKVKLMIFGATLYLISCLYISCTSEDMNDVNPGMSNGADSLLSDGGIEIDHDSTLLNLTDRYGIPMYQYAQVNKRGDYFRRMFIDSVSVGAILQNGQIPDGAAIAMETWFGASGQSTVFFRTKENDNWLSGSFSPSSPDLSKGITINSCNNCHNAAASRDFTFTRPLILRSFQKNEIQFVECDMGPTGPCDLEVYLGN